MQSTRDNYSDKNRTISAVISESPFVWIISFALLTAISAQISIPLKPVPITLQTMTVVLAGAFLGAKNGMYSQILYLFLGVIGLPVFALYPEAPIGLARIFGPTGGYLLAFPIAAFLTGYIVAKNTNYLRVVFAMFAGEFLILIIGMLFLNIFFIKNIELSIASGLLVFLAGTAVKVFSAAALFYGLKRSSEKY
jgi:biotin transport system substrate-specific component